MISANSFCILLALVLSAFDILGFAGRGWCACSSLVVSRLLMALGVATEDPAETAGEVSGVWGLDVTGGFGGGTGTESDPRAPEAGADINHCILRRKPPTHR